MTAHIILASIFLLSVLLLLIFAFLDDTSMYHDFGYLIATFTIIGIFSMSATIVQGICYSNKIHYRKRHVPLIEDVNNGYAKIIEYKTIKNGDTILFYNIEWLGNNQDGEREINK